MEPDKPDQPAKKSAESQPQHTSPEPQIEELFNFGGRLPDGGYYDGWVNEPGKPRREFAPGTGTGIWDPSKYTQPRDEQRDESRDEP